MSALESMGDDTVATSTDPPMPKDYGPNQSSASTATLAYAKKATDKPSGYDSEGDGGIPDGSFPCVESEFSSCTREKRWQTIDGMVNAEFGGVPEDYRHLTDEYEKVKAVRDVIDYAKGKKECTDAFNAVNATPIANQLKNLTIVTQNVFSEPLYDDHLNWTKGNGVASKMREQLKKTPSTRDVSSIGTYKYLSSENFTVQDSGMRFLGITNSAFDGIDHLSVAVIHSLVHTGGVGGQDPSGSELFSLKTTVTTHDLSYLGSRYTDILKHCTRERGSKLL